MIVVTGGAGFIGSCFIKKLNEIGRTDIIVVDNIGNTNKWKNLLNKDFLDYFDKTTFIDLIKNNELDNRFDKVLSKFNNIDTKIDYIFHFGACSSTTEMNFNYLLENNFEYSKLLFNYAKENSAKFIYASSAATYGLGEFGYSENLTNELRPLNGYGYSKQMFDIWLLKNGYINEAIGLKFFNVFGPNEYHKDGMASMIYKAYNQIKENGYINLFKSNVKEYSNGNQLRDFIYIKDTVDLVWDIVNTNQNGIYNIGTGQARSWNDLANSVFNTLKMPTDIRYIDMPQSISKQYQNYTEANLEKVNKLNSNFKINFKFRTLEESIADYINNHLNQDWQYL
ncbi:MAG: ADP-glyceromanno-heptose 6-epimerase [Candidatus Kapaibacteriota bacterium]|jgi:ADP-L-glycero-D-manno-heptose 6-epimerase